MLTEYPLSSWNQADFCPILAPLPAFVLFGAASENYTGQQLAVGCLPSFSPSAHLQDFLCGDTPTSKFTGEEHKLLGQMSFLTPTVLIRKRAEVSGMGRPRRESGTTRGFRRVPDPEHKLQSVALVKPFLCILTLQLWPLVPLSPKSL